MADEHEVLELDVDRLFFYRNNPRIDREFEDEDDLLIHLLTVEKAEQLAEDILKEGINPSERMIVVVDEEGDYVVMEGNRRLAALKGLWHPERVRDKKLRSRLEKLIEKYGTEKLPRKVEAVLCDEKQARVWMARRHASDADIGLRKWSPEEEDRFRKQTGSKPRYALAGALIEYAREKGLIAEESRPSLTTVDRFVSNRVVRRYLGLEEVPSATVSELKVTYPETQFNAMLRRFLEAVEHKEIISRTPGKKVEAMVEAWAGEEGVERLPEPWVWPEKQTREEPSHEPTPLKPPASNRKTASSSHSQSEQNAQSEQNEGAEPAQTEQPLPARSRDGRSNRKYLLHPVSGFPTSQDVILNTLRQELAQLNFRQHPMAAICCVRMMVERALYRYLHDVKGKEKLPAGVSRLARQVQVEEIDDKDIRTGMKLLRDDTTLLNRLNAGAHGAIKPDPDSVLDTWEQVETLVKWCIEQVEGMAKR